MHKWTFAFILIAIKKPEEINYINIINNYISIIYKYIGIINNYTNIIIN